MSVMAAIAAILDSASLIEVLGTPTGLWRAGGSATSHSYTLEAGATGLIVIFYDDSGQFATAATWTATGASAQPMTALTTRGTGDTSIRIFHLLSPSFGTSGGAGVISLTLSASAQPTGILPLSIEGWAGARPSESGQSGANLSNPPPFDLSAGPNSLIIHGVCSSLSGAEITFVPGETRILDGNAGSATVLRWAASKFSTVIGGTVSVDCAGFSGSTPIRFAESAVALSPVVAGARPAYGSAGTTTSSATLAGAKNMLYPTTVTAGDFLVYAAIGRNTNANATLALATAATDAGWQHVPNSPFQSASGNTGLLCAWKIADGSEGGTTLTGGITGGGGTTSDTFYGRMFRFTAADGFHASPIEDDEMLAPATGTTFAGPSLSGFNLNRLAVAFNFLSSATTVATAYTGATGGTWTERADTAANNGAATEIQVQTAPVDADISGGSFTLAASNFCYTFGLLLRPVNLASSGAPPVASLFSEDWTGANGAAWNAARWPTTATGGAGSNSTINIQGNAGRLNPSGTSGTYHYARALSASGTLTDLDLTALFTIGTTGEQYHHVVVRQTGGWASNPVEPLNGCRLAIWHDTAGRLSLEEVSSGAVVASRGGTINKTWGTGQWHLRMMARGSTIRAKTWQGATEPDAWDLEIQTTKTSGVVGLSSSNGDATTARPVTWDSLVVSPVIDGFPAWSWPSVSSLGSGAVREVPGAGTEGVTWDFIKFPSQAISDGSTLRLFYEGALQHDPTTGEYEWFRSLGMMTSTDPDNANSWTRQHTSSAAATYLPGPTWQPGGVATHEEGYFQLFVAKDPSTAGTYYCVFGGQDWRSGGEGNVGGPSLVDLSVAWQSSTDSGVTWSPNTYAGIVAAPTHIIIPANQGVWAHDVKTDEYWPSGLWYDSVNGRWHMTYETNDSDNIFHVYTETSAALGRQATPGDLIGREASSVAIWNTGQSGAIPSSQASIVRSCIADRGNGFVDIIATLFSTAPQNYRVARIPVINPRAAVWSLGAPQLLYHFDTGDTSFGIGNRTSGSLFFAQMCPPVVHGSRLVMPYMMVGTSGYSAQIRYFSVPLP